ncbi:aspartic peptidase domain-containing protein [Obelidium mucronatum]|nr:aspartic peptidase domain-containing protein [Obelidium mucronatum]
MPRSRSASIIHVLLLLACASAESVTHTPDQKLLRIPIQKGGWSLSRRDASTASQPSVASLINLGDLFYTSLITLGTPPQLFYVQVDTGSTTLWVGSRNCNAAGKCKEGNSFNPALSSTFKDTSRSVPTNLLYGKGEVAGYQSQDTFSWGTLAVLNQDFLLVEMEDAAVQAEKTQYYDGVLGLGRGNRNSVLNKFMQAKLTQEPIFSLWLNGTGDNNGLDLVSNGGEIVFGGVDSSHYSGSIVEYPVIDSSSWSIKSERVTIGGAAVPLPSGTKALLDSGTSLIVMSPSLLASVLPKIYESIGSIVPAPVASLGNFYIVDCKKVASLPEISFNFGDNNEYVLQWSDYVFPVTSSICGLGFQSNNVGNTIILGDIFLRKYYSTYNFQGPHVGLALAARTSKAFINSDVKGSIDSSGQLATTSTVKEIPPLIPAVTRTTALSSSEPSSPSSVMSVSVSSTVTPAASDTPLTFDGAAVFIQTTTASFSSTMGAEDFSRIIVILLSVVLVFV